MAKQVIGIGTTANDGTGDAQRDAFDKANDNFTELYDGKAAATLNGADLIPLVPEYTVAGVPSAASFDNHVIIVSDEAGGRTLATSDGTNWRRVSDGAVIS